MCIVVVVRRLYVCICWLGFCTDKEKRSEKMARAQVSLRVWVV